MSALTYTVLIYIVQVIITLMRKRQHVDLPLAFGEDFRGRLRALVLVVMTLLLL